MTARQVARLAKCAEQTVSEHRRKGTLQAVRRPGGHLFCEEDVEIWIASRTVPPDFLSSDQVAAMAGICRAWVQQLLSGHGRLFGGCVFYSPIVVADFLRERELARSAP